MGSLCQILPSLEKWAYFLYYGHMEAINYSSINTVLNEKDAAHYPAEFLNNLSVSGLPAHMLALKVGVLIILMTNLKPPHLCNGT